MRTVLSKFSTKIDTMYAMYSPGLNFVVGYVLAS